MPAFNVAGELSASVVDLVEPIEVMDGPTEGVAEHAFGQGGEVLRGIILEEVGGGIGCVVGLSDEGVELIFR